jgi:hypothetical protein
MPCRSTFPVATPIREVVHLPPVVTYLVACIAASGFTVGVVGLVAALTRKRPPTLWQACCASSVALILTLPVLRGVWILIPLVVSQALLAGYWLQSWRTSPEARGAIGAATGDNGHDWS